MTDFTAVADECARRSSAGEITFPEVIGKLIAADVETYHVDYIRGETTYYAVDGRTHIIPLKMPDTQIEKAFSAAGVEAAVRASQRGEIKFPEFLVRTCAAGCVGYLACLHGKRVVYLGRTGDSHTEHFPQ